jgi:hypothetical protein
MLTLAACGNTPSNVSATKATISAAEGTLTAAGKAVVGCYAVPACNAKATAPIKAQIKQAFDSAYGLVTSAQATADAGGSPDLTAMTAAVNALEAAMTQLPR